MRFFAKRYRRLHRSGRRHIIRRPYLLPIFGLILGVAIVAGVFHYRGGTEAFRPSDSHVVFLFDSGKKQTIDTKAKTVGELVSRLDLHLIPEDVVEPSADTPIVEDNFRINVYHARPVTVVDSGTKNVTLTAQKSARVVAEGAEDQASFAQGSIADSVVGEQVVVARATPVMLNLYGTQVPSYTQARTVASLLTEKHIKLNNGEMVNPVPATPVTPNMQIFILAKGSQVITTEETVPAPVQAVRDITLSFGTKVVRQQGAPGKQAVTYLITMDKGVETSRKVIQQAIVQAAVPEIDAIGATIDINGDKTSIMAAAGIASSDYAYANFIVSHESGWRPQAANASGAYGLCQALPGGKMASAGADWATNPITQLKWCSGYAHSRFGGWGAAYNYWLAHRNW
jgi:uncharacterized protein YabE (DUF348 family)